MDPVRVSLYPGRLHRFRAHGYPLFEKLFHFFKEPVFHHFKNPRIDSFVEFFSRDIQRQDSTAISSRSELMFSVEFTEPFACATVYGEPTENSLGVRRRQTAGPIGVHVL